MVFFSIFLHQIFFSFCFYLQDFIKFVRLFLAALSINGLTHLCLRVLLQFFVRIHDNFENNLVVEDYFAKYLKKTCC